MQLSYRDFATRQYEPTFMKNLIVWSISIKNNFAVELSANYLWDIDDDPSELHATLQSAWSSFADS